MNTNAQTIASNSISRMSGFFGETVEIAAVYSSNAYAAPLTFTPKLTIIKNGLTLTGSISAPYDVENLYAEFRNDNMVFAYLPVEINGETYTIKNAPIGTFVVNYYADTLQGLGNNAILNANSTTAGSIILQTTLVYASGTISGIIEVGTVLAENTETLEKYTAVLNADGTFNIILLTQGTYNFEFISGDKIAYSLKNDCEVGEKIINETAIDGTYRITDSITLNGTTLNSKHRNGSALTTTVGQRAAYATANTTAVIPSAYNVALANTVVSGDRAYEFELSMNGAYQTVGGFNNWQYSEYGIGITNGSQTIFFTLLKDYGNGTNCVKIALENADGSSAGWCYVNVGAVGGFNGWDNTSEWTKLKVVKTANSITVYRCGNLINNYVIAYVINSNGTIVDNTGAATAAFVTADYISSLFDANKEQAITLASGNLDNLFVNLKISPSFVKHASVSGTIIGVTEVGTVLAENTADTSKKYTAVLNADGTYAMGISAGTYNFEYISGDKVFYALDQVCGTNGLTVSGTATDGTYRITDSITLNGTTLNSKHRNGSALTTTVAQRAAYATANTTAIIPSAYNVALANTVVSGDDAYEFEMQLSGSCITVSGGYEQYMYNEYGFGISNGSLTIRFTLLNDYGTGKDKVKITYIDANGNNGGSCYVGVGTVGGFNGWDDKTQWTKLKVVKTATSITVYRCGSVISEYQVACVLNFDGTIVDSTGAATATFAPTAFITSLFDANTAQVITLASDNYDALFTDLTIKPTYTVA